jgi:hypothetical protein
MGVILEGFAEVSEELLQASDGALVAFDLAGPPAGGGVGCQGLLDLAPGPKPWGVGRCGDELRTGQVEIALAGAFLGSRRQWPRSSSVLKKLVLSQSTVESGRAPERSSLAAGPAIVAPGARTVW